jgi:hypothetical protein
MEFGIYVRNEKNPSEDYEESEEEEENREYA